MKLLTLSDGYGDPSAMPSWYSKYLKWPKIIELMTQGVTVNNLSKFGAGNEYLVNALRNNIHSADLVLLQWAVPNRLDLMVSGDNKYWNQIIADDPVYNNNIVVAGPERFWLSSGSKSQPIVDYHSRYISLSQHQSRSQLFVEYAKLLLDQHGIDYRFMLTWDSFYLNKCTSTDINWCWHQPFRGMHDFRVHSKFADLDLKMSQPIPLIHFDFIKQFIMPSVGLPWRNSREINAVESMLYRHYQESKSNQPQ
jgi:hypothetical protein